MLMPAGVLIVVVLAAIAVDFSVLFLAERELISAAGAAANDAVGAGLDGDAYRDVGEVTFDPERATAVAREAVQARAGSLPIDEVDISTSIGPAGEIIVEVSAVADVELIFARALPFVPDRVRVDATASAAGLFD